MGGMAHLRVALTGGIASGKSLVAAELERLGAIVIDADVLSRQVVEPGTPGLAEVTRRFGPQVLNPDGSLNRTKLGEIVFNDDAAREDLNAIIHPAVIAERNRLDAQAPDGSVVVSVIPLLVETGQQNSFDSVIVVDIPEGLQLTRLEHRNNLTPEQAQSRILAQAPRAARLAVADHIIDNSGSKQETLTQVATLWNELTQAPSLRA
jgi:dephospho-CoA kinase